MAKETLFKTIAREKKLNSGFTQLNSEYKKDTGGYKPRSRVRAVSGWKLLRGDIKIRGVLADLAGCLLKLRGEGCRQDGAQG